MVYRDAYTEEVHWRRRKRRWILFFIFLVLALGGIASGGGWLIFRSDIFRVRAIEISGNTTLRGSDIIEFTKTKISDNHRFAVQLFGFQSMLAWPTVRIEDNKGEPPALKSLTIRKNYARRSIEIAVKEREPYGIWCKMPGGENASSTDVEGSSDRCFWFDKEGILFKKSFVIEGGNLIPLLHDYSGRNLAVFSKILPDTSMPNLISIFDVLRASDLTAEEFRLEEIGLEETAVTTKNGPTLYFSLRFPADSTLAVLESIMKKSDFKSLRSIDFRVENRVYYK